MIIDNKMLQQIMDAWNSREIRSAPSNRIERAHYDELVRRGQLMVTADGRYQRVPDSSPIAPALSPAKTKPADQG